MADRPRADFAISAKVGRLMQPDASVTPGENGWAAPLPFRPVYDYTHAGVMRPFEDSLQRLGLERIDLLFVHDIGEVTHGPQDAAVWAQLTRGGGFRALETLRREGRIAGFGVNKWQVMHASMQDAQLDCFLLAGHYTLPEQDRLTPFLDDCVSAGHCIVIGGAFNSGVLAGNNKFNYADAPASVVDRMTRLAQTCKDFDVSLQAAAVQLEHAHRRTPAPGGRPADAATVGTLQPAEHPSSRRLGFHAHGLPSRLRFVNARFDVRPRPTTDTHLKDQCADCHL